MGLWTKGSEKYPNFGYLDNRCHGNQKTSPELIKHLKGYGILSGGHWVGRELLSWTSVTMVTTLLPWQQNSTNWQCCNPTNKALGEGQGASIRLLIWLSFSEGLFDP